MYALVSLNKRCNDMHEGNGQTKKVLPKQLGPLVMTHISNMAILSLLLYALIEEQERASKPVFSSVLVKLHLVHTPQSW
jgi:hypothetical protein